MYIPYKKHNLTENQVQKFMDSLPESIEESEFLALICMMIDLYGFHPNIVSIMCERMIEDFGEYNLTKIRNRMKKSMH